MHHTRILTAPSKWLAPLLILICLLLSPLHALAADYAMTNLRVGFFAFEGYHNLAADGSRSGYGYDLLQLMARYENMEYTYLGYEKSLAESERMLERGEIDLLTAVKWNEDREKKFDFSSRNIGTASTQITVKAGNTDIISGNYSTYNGARFGILRGTTRNKELSEFARKNGFSYQSFFYDTTQEMAQALQDGQIDALVSSSLRAHTGEWVIDSFNEAPIYAVVRKGDTKTLALINHALDRMELEEHHWRTHLPDKYYDTDHNHLIFLTESEQAYLQQKRQENRVFQVLVNPDRYPYSYIKDGQLQGIMIDLFDLIASRAGIQYAWIYTADREEYAQRMLNKKTDICIDMAPNFSQAESLGYIITDVYLTAPFSWIRRVDTSGNVSMAAKLLYTANTPAQYAYHNTYHNIEYIEYATQEECLRSVKDGVTDGYCTYTYQAEEIILKDASNSLMATTAQTENQFVIGTAQHIDRNLDSILNKAASSITNGERIQAIRNHATLISEQASIGDLIRENSAVRFAAIAVLVATLMFLFLIAQQQYIRHGLNDIILKQSKRINESISDMLSLLASAIEFRSSESGSHIKRISSITSSIVKALTRMYPSEYKFTPEQIDQIATAAVLHDVGKIAIPDYILNKPGKLSSTEFKIMQQHPVKGCELLERIPTLENNPLYNYAYDICRWHHERWDGRGYPDGLSGDNIPIWAQAASVADVYDALTSPRTYKEAFSKNRAVQMICNGECGQFNPKVLKAFRSVVDQIESAKPEEPSIFRGAPAGRDITTLTLSAFHYLINNTTDIIFLKDVDLVYRAASPSFATFIGKHSPEDVICHTDAELFPNPQVAQRHVDEDRELLSSGVNLIDSLDPLGERDGMAVYGSTSKYLLTDSQGRIMGILGITRDITSSYLTQKHHQMELQSLFTLPENAYFSLYLDLSSWKILAEKYQEIRGVLIDEFKTIEDFATINMRSIRDRRAPAYALYRNFTRNALMDLYESGKYSLVLECSRLLPGGQERWVRNELRFLVNPSNGHLCMTVILIDIHEQKEQELKTIQRAEHDTLTGLLNRSSFFEMMEQTPSTTEKANVMHALLIIDLDDFKRINDTWGHQAGDHALRVCANTLRDSFRISDLVGRLGGDEFVVLMRFISNREAVRAKADALLETIQKAPLGYEDVALSISIGVAVYPADGEDSDTLYARADKALYQAKQLGKNKACFADELQSVGGYSNFEDSLNLL